MANPLNCGASCDTPSECRVREKCRPMATPPYFAAAERDVSGLLDRLNAAYFAHVGAVGNDRVNVLCELVRDAHSSLSALRAEVERVTGQRDVAQFALQKVSELFDARVLDEANALNDLHDCKAEVAALREDKAEALVVMREAAARCREIAGMLDGRHSTSAEYARHTAIGLTAKADALDAALRAAQGREG